MGTRRYEFHTDIEGPLAENEDWWTLLVGGRRLAVEHRWRRTDRSRGKVLSESVWVYSLPEFRRTEAGAAYKAELDGAIQLAGLPKAKTIPYGAATPPS